MSFVYVTAHNKALFVYKKGFEKQKIEACGRNELANMNPAMNKHQLHNTNISTQPDNICLLSVT